MKTSKDPLGERMKANYEDRYRFSIPRRTYSILRLDGKAFHTYTKHLAKPFDRALIEDIDNAVKSLMGKMQNAEFAYCQSDEISILMTDFATPETQMWFDGNIQKITSVSASILTAEFNKLRFIRTIGEPDSVMYNILRDDTQREPYYSVSQIQNTEFAPLANFDARLFVIPDRTEVMNYFRWRSQDCIRNSISMVAQNLYSHKELHGKNSQQQKELIALKGKAWDTYEPDVQYGRIIQKGSEFNNDVVRKPHSNFAVSPAWDFTHDDGKLLNLIPQYT
jgi:tRNA(His) guanylyltransferase